MKITTALLTKGVEYGIITMVDLQLGYCFVQLRQNGNEKTNKNMPVDESVQCNNDELLLSGKSYLTKYL